MKIVAKYIHGSQDSIDVDVYYVYEEFPNIYDCQNICKSNQYENINIIEIENGAVTKCFKGTVDEVNNGLLDTYYLHEQQFPLSINKRLDRDILFKHIRSLRGMLSYISRTKYREQVKLALNSNWINRLKVFNNIDYCNLLSDSDLSKKYNKYDIIKFFAFQLGQSVLLAKGTEVYTKNDIAKYLPKLHDYLYRKDKDLTDLIYYINEFRNILSKYEVVELDNNISRFLDFDRKINIKNEKEIFINEQ